MSEDNLFLYKVRRHHKEIIGTEEPCSFYQLLYVVEAPMSFTGINIWEYVERISVEDLKAYYNSDTPINTYQLSRDECKQYPYYELFWNMNQNLIQHPLIVEQSTEQLFVLEGRHRLRLMILFSIFQHRYLEIPCIIVEKTEKQDDRAYRNTDAYLFWTTWLHKNNFPQVAKQARDVFTKFVKDD